MIAVSGELRGRVWQNKHGTISRAFSISALDIQRFEGGESEAENGLPF